MKAPSSSSSETFHNTFTPVFAVALGLTAFCFPVSIAASSLIFFPLVGVYILAAPWTFKLWPPTPGRVETAFLVFWGFSLISALAGVDPWHSRVRLFKDFYVVLIPLLGALLYRKPPEEGLRLMTIFLWGGLLTAAFGILQYTLGINQTESTLPMMNVPAWLTRAPHGLLDKLALVDGRATGLRGHPLTFAESLLFPLAFALSLLVTELKRPGWRTLLAPCVLLLALLFSQSRGPWLAFGAMTVVLCVLETSLFQLARRIWPVVVFPVILVICIPALQQRAVTIRDTKYNSNAERLFMWKAGAEMIKDHPLMGVGTGNIKMASPAYQTPEQNQAYGAWGHLHNMYVNVAAERGLLGLGLFLFFIGSLGWTLFQSYRAMPPDQKQSRVLVLTAILSLVGWLSAGVTETIYNDTSILMMFYFVMGIGLVYCRTWREWSR